MRCQKGIKDKFYIELKQKLIENMPTEEEIEELN